MVVIREPLEGQGPEALEHQIDTSIAQSCLRFKCRHSNTERKTSTIDIKAAVRERIVFSHYVSHLFNSLKVENNVLRCHERQLHIRLGHWLLSAF